MLGLYYVSLMRDGEPGQYKAATKDCVRRPAACSPTIGEIEAALQSKAVTLAHEDQGPRLDL